MKNTIATYARLVKFSHTVFALPFALIGFAYGVTVAMPEHPWLLFAQVIVCMVTARSAAMAFNRWADRHIDAANPRTAGREIPAGKISPWGALVFCIVNSALFVATAITINPLTGRLSPVALAVILGYSYCKRFTALAHIVLGMALAIAPAGAYIAVTGNFTMPIAVPMVYLSITVLTWCAGFDILYALQDEAFDKTHHLHSIPSRCGTQASRWIAIAMHAASIAALWGFATHCTPHCEAERHVWLWAGVAIFVALLLYQHIRKAPFDIVNGLASIGLAVCVIIDIFV